MNTLRFKLDYGRTGLDVVLPADRVVGPLEIRQAPPLEHPDLAVIEALKAPIGTPPDRGGRAMPPEGGAPGRGTAPDASSRKAHASRIMRASVCAGPKDANKNPAGYSITAPPRP